MDDIILKRIILLINQIMYVKYLTYHPLSQNDFIMKWHHLEASVWETLVPMNREVQGQMSWECSSSSVHQKTGSTKETASKKQEVKLVKCVILKKGKQNISRDMKSKVHMSLKDPIDLLTKGLLMFWIRIVLYKNDDMRTLVQGWLRQYNILLWLLHSGQ